jgi:alpha-glucosidase
VYHQAFVHNRDLPETHALLRRLRRFTDGWSGDRVLIGEIFVPTLERWASYYGPNEDEVHLPFNFFLPQVPALDARAFRSIVRDTEAVCCGRWTTHVLSNHDRTRAIDQYGDGAHDDRIATLLATMLLTLRGTPFIYYGEEIGLRGREPASVDEVQDPVGRRYWPRYKGRDAFRGPMCWDASPHAGFSTAQPWLPLADGWRTRNVAAQSVDSASILNFYRRLLRVRRASDALRHGTYHEWLPDHPAVFAYERRHASERVRVALNMSATPQRIDLDGTWRLLLTTVGAGARSVGPDLRLDPYEAAIVADAAVGTPAPRRPGVTPA